MNAKRTEFVKTVREVRKTYEGKTYTYGYVYLHLPAEYAGKKVRIVVEPLREPEPQQAQAQPQAQPQQDFSERLRWQREMDKLFPTAIYVPPGVHRSGEPHDPRKPRSELEKRLASLRYEPLRLTPRELARIVKLARREALRPSLTPRELARIAELARRAAKQKLGEEERLEIQ